MRDWISVFDRLPPEGVKVEAAVEAEYAGLKCTVLQYLVLSDGIWRSPAGEVQPHGPTHWRPATKG